MKITLGSLFDGSGGFPLAGSMCGIEPVWAAEIEPYPIAVTRSRFPNMKHLGSVTDIHGGEIEPVDIITFGSPCQDLSVAGKRAGLKHEANGDEQTTRSGLFVDAVRIIREMREATNGEYPKFALWENVPGAFSSNGGEDFRTVLGQLIGIVEPGATMPPVPKAGWAFADSYTGDGWSLAYRVFNAQHWGVPHRRRRIHLVLDLRGQRARQVLFEREGVRGYFAPSGAAGQGAAENAQGSPASDDRAGEGRGLDATKGTYQNTGIGWWNESDVAATLRTLCGGDSTLANTVVEETGGVAFAKQAFGEYKQSSIASTQRESQYKEPSDLVRTEYIVRRLTPTECARLQGFPDMWGYLDAKDDFTEEEFRFWLNVRNTHAAINGKQIKEYTKAQMLKWYKGLHTDSAEYKMWGNGIALPPALYCMQGMVKALRSDWLDELLKGDVDS